MPINRNKYVDVNSQDTPIIKYIKVSDMRFGLDLGCFIPEIDSDGILDSANKSVYVANFIGVKGITGNFAYLFSDMPVLKALFPDLETLSGAINMFYSSNIEEVTLNKLREISALGGQNCFRECESLAGIDMPSLVLIGDYGCENFVYGDGSLKYFKAPVLTSVGERGLSGCCMNCYGLEIVDLRNLTTIGNYGMYQAFSGCTSLVSLNLSGVETIDRGALSYICYGDTNLESVDLSGLVEIPREGLSNAFNNCKKLETVVLSSVEKIRYYRALYRAFFGDTALKELSFPALKDVTDEHDVNTNQFNNMLERCSGVTVHFPSNMESVIGSWSDVTSGFGGTDTTVLFDLPSTGE